MIDALQHVGQGVWDADVTYEFYRRLFGYNVKLNYLTTPERDMAPIIGSVETAFPEGLAYTSDKSDEWLTVQDLQGTLADTSFLREESATSPLFTIHRLNEKVIVKKGD